MGDLNDELIWNIIGKEKFCSYKFNTKTQNFCRNEFNITGFCSKQSCPISNSNYATIIEKNGEIYLYIKDTTNIRFPDKLWKKFKLSRNFIKSFQEIDLILNLWPKFFVFKSKQRLTKLWQMLLRDKLNKVKKKIFRYLQTKKYFT
jgi:protein MAK16